MKILHITDSHGTVKSPESRTDLYYLAFLRKMAEITYAIKLHKIDMVIHTGDLFHSSRVSNKFMGQVAEIIKGWKIPLYVVPGNHDIDGYSIDTIDQTSLGLLAKTGVLTLLTRANPIKINTSQNGKNFTVAISGQEYYADIDTGNMEDFEMQQPEADINILAIHGYIADTQQHPNIRCTYPKDIITDADIVLSGHYHRSFAIDVGDVAYYNPGSMLRVEMTEYNKTHIPKYGVLDIELDNQGYIVYDYKFHQFRVAKQSTTIFDFNTTNALKKHGITLEGFKTSIANTMQSINTNTGATPIQTIESILNEYCISKQYSSNKTSKMKLKADSIYATACQQTMNEDIISVKGFVPSNVPVKIKSIDIENFQSHENTHVDFDSGLNIIIGESNQGKTVLLRSVDWVVNNQPLGTDFIMTGKNYCKVRITYDNNTFIERYRTLKDTGYYRVGFIDNNGQETYQEYKGFTNNVPVEVMNVHQMPKVAITKNIETHLNKIGQLERPFLITENTNEKAVAIGRITGTDIIDVGVKNITSDTTADKTLIKSYIKSKEELENKKSLIDITKITTLKKFYELALVKITKLNTLYNSAMNLKQVHENCNHQINCYTNSITRCESIIKEKIQVSEAVELINKINSMVMLLNKYKQCTKSTMDLKDKVNVYTETIKQKNIIGNCDNAISKIQLLMTLLNKEQNIAGLINSQKQTIEKLNTVISYNEILDDAIKRYNLIKQEMVLYNRNKIIQTNIQNYSDDSSCVLAIIGNLNSEIEEYQNTMKEFVLSNKICPCCGQKITDKNVSSIINNFSKEG